MDLLHRTIRSDNGSIYRLTPTRADHCEGGADLRVAGFNRAWPSAGSEQRAPPYAGGVQR